MPTRLTGSRMSDAHPRSRCRSHGESLFFFTELLAQLVSRLLQGAAPFRRAGLAGAIYIEVQHGESRAKSCRLPVSAHLGGMFQRRRDALGALPSEHTLLEIERMTMLGHIGRPIFCCLFRQGLTRPFAVPFCLSCAL